MDKYFKNIVIVIFWTFSNILVLNETNNNMYVILISEYNIEAAMAQGSSQQEMSELWCDQF